MINKGNALNEFRFHLSRIVFLPFIVAISCNKLVSVPEPISSVTSAQVFSNDANATSAMLGIYSYMSGSQGESFSDVAATQYPGSSADELTDELPGNEVNDIFLTNQLTPTLTTSGTLSQYFWAPAYYDIYNANAIISGVQSSSGMSTSAKVELAGEAKFIRAFCYFYLTNLFGDLPLDLSINFNQTVLLAKTPQDAIYKQIIADLTDAQDSLPGDFWLSGGMPIRANKWAATALLARVYLYRQDWDSALSAANAVINAGQFRLVGLDSVFLANSPEAILQLQTSDILYPYATLEASVLLPYVNVFGPRPPAYWLTSQLLTAFEANDMRWSAWVDSSVNNNGGYYYYAYKYKQRLGSAGVAPAENYTLLRFAEQYLIRAEAEANLGELNQAVNDINIIRARANLPNLSNGLSQSQVLAAIQQENRIEFFAELGHRWLDLKRWGIGISTLDTISYKSGIDSTQLLYPIPLNEIQTDPNLTQNPGYGR